MDLLAEVVTFAAKGAVVFFTITLTALVLLAISRRRRVGGGAHLEVKPLNERYQALGDALRAEVMDKKEYKAHAKAQKKNEKGKSTADKPNLYVLKFDGDILASAVKSLREEVTAVIAVARPGDEVVLMLESPGGAVPHYGLAAAQLTRLKDKKLKLTVCIDRVAASGGYLMACVADQVVAAPFSIIGSIGVVAQVPNLHRLLKKHDVDFHEMTAGEFKRTVSVLGEITDKGRQKFQEQLEETHGLFKDFVKEQRPKLDVQQVATGEYWLGRKAKELGLVDALHTSDDYLLGRLDTANIYKVRFEPASTLRERLSRTAAEVVDRSVLSLLSRLMQLELR